MHSERITYLTNAENKAALEAFAKARGQSVGKVLREAAARYMDQPTPQEEEELAALVEQVNEAIPKINASLDRMSATMRQLKADNDAFFRERGIDA